MNPDELADLEEQRDFLVRSLDDLERELGAGDIDALDAATLRQDYAERLDQVRTAIATGQASLLHRERPRRRGRVVATVGLVAVLAVGAGVAVAQTSGSRKPGDTATGNIRESSNNKLAQASQLAQAGDYVEALELYDEVLAADAENVEALAERGLLLVSLAGSAERPELATRGRESIEAALRVDPDNPRSLFYLGLAKRLQGDDAGASEAFDAALAADPPAALRKTIEDFRASIEG